MEAGLNLVSLGMMVYTSIYSIGVFWQDGEVPAVWFVLLTPATLMLLYFLVFIPQAGRSPRQVDTTAAIQH